MKARIAFDLDGTLIDSARDIQSIANAALDRVGAPPITMDETHEFVGEGIAVFVAKMRAARGLPDSLQEDLLADLVARYDDAVTLTTAYPGVPSVLSELAKSHRLGVCTNKLHSPAMAVLRHLGLDAYFDAVWGGDNPLGRKPDPAPLLATFRELGDGPCFFVGDSEVDSETAKAAGIPFLLFTEGYRKTPAEKMEATARFSRFDELPSIIESLLAG